MSLSNICMLCLQSSEVLIEIFSRRGIELNLEDILKEHFWFQVDEYEEKSICGKCWQTVYDFHLLYTCVERKHRQQSDFYVKTEIVDSNDYNELPVLLNTVKVEPNIDINNELDNTVKIEPNIDINNDLDNTVKDEPNVDIKNELDCLPPGISDIPCNFDVTRVKRKYNRKFTSTEIVYKSDYHTKLLSTYFTMSCDLCDACLPTYQDAKRHYRIVHNIKNGYLICCSKKFFLLPDMLQHCQWHINPDSFKCDHCPKTYINSHRFQMHMNACHSSESGKVFQCSDCDEVFLSQQCLDAHVKNVSHMSDYLEEQEIIKNRFLMQCDLCDEPFVTFREVKIHHATAHNQAGYLYCCDRKFFKMSNALEHCIWHDDSKSLECSICQIFFMNRLSLRDHIWNVHTPQDESFADSSILKSHMKVHDSDEQAVMGKLESRQFECHICRKRMKHKDSLKDHIRWHNSKTATCGICKQVFRNVKALRGHIQSTHREPSFECTVCGKMFKKNIALKKHLAIHAGVADLIPAHSNPTPKRIHPELLEQMETSLISTATPAETT